jgi:hypothetical protein
VLAYGSICWPPSRPRPPWNWLSGRCVVFYGTGLCTCGAICCAIYCLCYSHIHDIAAVAPVFGFVARCRKRKGAHRRPVAFAEGTAVLASPVCWRALCRLGTRNCPDALPVHVALRLVRVESSGARPAAQPRAANCNSSVLLLRP